MRGARLLPFALLGLCASAAPAVSAEIADPAANPAKIVSEIAAAHLEPARAVSLKKLKVNAGLGTLRLDDGVLIPASSVGGKTIEMVFLGSGRIELDPPDAIEAGQLELFTGGARLDQEFQEAVLVVGLDAAATAMLRRPAAQPDVRMDGGEGADGTRWERRADPRLFLRGGALQDRDREGGPRQPAVRLQPGELFHRPWRQGGCDQGRVGLPAIL
ncbi:MAG TPA: hypothetical protein VLV54_15925 [Thermoanaerobaculia bacterium]|nr:hypothetical protein [Thermoanaerobaculia bacterium]